MHPLKGAPFAEVRLGPAHSTIENSNCLPTGKQLRLQQHIPPLALCLQFVHKLYPGGGGHRTQ